MENIKIEIINCTMQARCEHSEAVVEEYAEAMLDGKKFPPVKIAFAETRFYVTDGIHRIMAAKKIGRKTIPAIVTKCSLAAAWRAALGSNANHGLRRSNEDKQHAMMLAWDNRQLVFGGNPSARALADVCAVTAPTASAFIDKQNKAAGEGCKDFTPPQQVVGRDGKLYPQRPVRPVRAPLPTAPVRPSAPVVTAAAPVAAAPAAPVRPAHVVPTDRFGVEIPVPLQPAFNGDNADKLAQLVRLISEARCLCKRETESGNLAFAAVRQELLMQLNTAYNFASAAAPHCVCRMCQGNGCTACHGRGWQTEDEHGRNPDDFKGVEVRT